MLRPSLKGVLVFGVLAVLSCGYAIVAFWRSGEVNTDFLAGIAAALAFLASAMCLRGYDTIKKKTRFAGAPGWPLVVIGALLLLCSVSIVVK
jgi:hypothetical protein